MRRWLFNLAAAVSLVLCFGTVGLWMLPEEAKYHDFGDLAGLGQVELSQADLGHRGTGWDGVRYSHYLYKPRPSRTWSWGGFGIDVKGVLRVVGSLFGMQPPYLIELDLYFPYWSFALVFAVLPSAWILKRLRTRKNDPDLCPTCSYNLKGNTSGVCPECGTPVPKAPAEKSPRPA